MTPALKSLCRRAAHALAALERRRIGGPTREPSLEPSRLDVGVGAMQVGCQLQTPPANMTIAPLPVARNPSHCAVEIAEHQQGTLRAAQETFVVLRLHR